MRMILAGAVALTALTACSTAPMNVAATAPATPTVQLSAKERLVKALEANGCVLNVNTIGKVLAQATISNDEIVQLVPQLEAEGRAEIANDGEIRILTDNCV